MIEPNEAERVQPGDDLVAAARDAGIEQLEGVKGQLAEGAERVAAAVDRAAENFEAEGGEAVSGFGHSVSGLMRQLAGGLRERDVEQFAAELGALARRNPAVFLAGSVALGFGVARFFKARAPQARTSNDYGWNGGGQRAPASRRELDEEESLDLSGNPAGVDRRDDRSYGDDHRGATNEPALAQTAAQTDSVDATESAAEEDIGGEAGRGGKQS